MCCVAVNEAADELIVHAERMVNSAVDAIHSVRCLQLFVHLSVRLSVCDTVAKVSYLIGSSVPGTQFYNFHTDRVPRNFPAPVPYRLLRYVEQIRTIRLCYLLRFF